MFHFIDVGAVTLTSLSAYRRSPNPVLAVDDSLVFRTLMRNQCTAHAKRFKEPVFSFCS